VGTPGRVYAISPANPVGFLDTFARAVELGSLREARAKSEFPSLVFANAWESGIVRYLWLVTLFLNLGLAAWISMLIPSSPLFSLGLRPDRTPDAIPSSQLIIIPLLSALLSLVGWIAVCSSSGEQTPVTLDPAWDSPSPACFCAGGSIHRHAG
jgi:hypothetical protein